MNRKHTQGRADKEEGKASEVDDMACGDKSMTQMDEKGKRAADSEQFREISKTTRRKNRNERFNESIVDYVNEHLHAN